MHAGFGFKPILSLPSMKCLSLLAALIEMGWYELGLL